MPIEVSGSRVRSILTRSSGYLRDIASHSLQPYRGCSFGNSLCGIGCYAQHNRWLTRGASWGGFLEARLNAADAYRDQYVRERAWARRARGLFSIFMSSSTDPFVPQEPRFRITERVLRAMQENPPDTLIIQTHTHLVTRYLDLYEVLRTVCRLRVHISIESDRDRLPGLPPPASPVRRRLAAARSLKDAGVPVVITVSPLLPIEQPEVFFTMVAESADAVVLDHYIEGDGTPDGSRTLRTPLPAAMAAVNPASTSLAYRDQMVSIAQRIMPGKVGISAPGFAGRFLAAR
jgi:DNA repair photolyase